MEYTQLAELAQKFGYDAEFYGTDDIPTEIVDAMEYIDENTGLLGDYNEGHVVLAEGGTKIQWYSRSSTTLSAHNGLMLWVQEEHPDLLLGHIGTRPRVDDDSEEMKPSTYVEIHTTEVWGYDDE